MAAVAQDAAGFSIVFPDVPGCASCGDTVDEALAMGQEALEGHLESLRENGDLIPDPTEPNLEMVIEDYGVEGEIHWLGFFPISIAWGRSQPDVGVSLPRSLIKDLDQLVPDSRRFIIDMTRRELERLRKSA